MKKTGGNGGYNHKRKVSKGNPRTPKPYKKTTAKRAQDGTMQNKHNKRK